jgi:hypothetical protein
MVGCASLVVTNIMYNHDRKLEIRVGNCSFLLHLVNFDSNILRIAMIATTHVSDFYGVILRGVMVGYASLVVTNIMYSHDRKLEIRVENCCFLLQLVSFVSSASVKDSLYCNDLDNVRFRFFVELFLGELWLDVHRWWLRISCTTTMEKSTFKSWQPLHLEFRCRCSHCSICACKG